MVRGSDIERYTNSEEKGNYTTFSIRSVRFNIAYACIGFQEFILAGVYIFKFENNKPFFNYSYTDYY